MVDNFEAVAYRNDASEKRIIKKVIKKMIFLFLLYEILFFGKIIKKQHNSAIIGIYKGL